MKHAVAAALLLAVMGSAQAQTAAPPEAQPGPSTAPADEAVALPPIVVTAEKSGRSIMDTAASTVVLDAEDLEGRAGLATVKDALATVPNVVLVGTGNIAPAIRGVDGTGAAQGFDAFVAGSRPRLNLQIDGRPASYNEIVFGDSAMWDVQQVEVLRGAQSTLQGRNAIAGTVVVKTKDPSFEPEGALRLAAGNYDQRRASGTVSGPLFGDSLAYRVAADWIAWHTFVEGWEGFPGVDDPGEFESLNLRGKLLFEPRSLPGLRSLLTLNHADYRGPQTEDVSRPFENRENNFPYTEPVFTPRTSSAIVDTEYTFNPQLRLQGVVSATDLGVERKTTPGDGIADIDGREYVVEPRLHFSGAGRRSGVAGVYLFKADQDEFLDSAGGLRFDDHIRTAALFGEGTWPLSETVDLIGGMRYEREQHRRDGDGAGGFIAVDLDETYNAFLPKLGLAWHLRETTTVGSVVSRGYNGGGAGAAINEEGTQITNYQYDPEYVWTGEIYLRQELADRRARLTANLFYSDYRDMQLVKDLTPQQLDDYDFIVTNADEVRTWGAEAGITWLATSALELYANLGVLKAEISNYPDSGYDGNELPLSPTMTASGGFSWARDGWDANLNLRYSGSYYSEIANQPRGEVDPYWVANVQLGYRFLAHLRVYTSVDNLFDSDEPMAVYPGAVPEEDAANLLPPRMYWVGLQLDW